jgi:hypothetical protein
MIKFISTSIVIKCPFSSFIYLSSFLVNPACFCSFI